MIHKKVNQYLLARKKRQISSFFSDPKKTSRLLQRARKDWRVIGFNRDGLPKVYRVFIQGKDRVVKFDSKELLARSVVRQISRHHDLAVKSGSISVSRYKLARLKYFYADSRVGVMQVVDGVPYDTLRAIMRHMNKYSNKEVVYDYGEMGLKVLEFLKKYPSLTQESLFLAKDELWKNLSTLKDSSKISTFDLNGKDNLFFRGIDKRSGKIVFTLIDPIHPYPVIVR